MQNGDPLLTLKNLCPVLKPVPEEGEGHLLPPNPVHCFPQTGAGKTSVDPWIQQETVFPENLSWGYWMQNPDFGGCRLGSPPFFIDYPKKWHW